MLPLALNAQRPGPDCLRGGRPGRHWLCRESGATGWSFHQTDLAIKRLELLREVVRALRRLAILAVAGNPVTLWDMREVEAAARTFGLTVVTVEIRRIENIAPGFQAREDRADMFRPIRS